MALHSAYDWIYLSPHLDDAALSCGGQIFTATQRGERVLIVTITAGDPQAAVSEYAASLHTRWQVVDATEARRQEDLAVCAILGADALHWDVPDCIYRTDSKGKPFYVSDADIFGVVAPAEMAMVAELAAQMQALPHVWQVVAPLGVGQHVDHQLTRLAAEQAFDSTTLRYDPLRYYEDYPYAQQSGRVAQALEQTKARWTAEVVELGAQALGQKYAAIAAFRSQVSTFFKDQADLEAQVGGYAAKIGGERRWRRLPMVK